MLGGSAVCARSDGNSHGISGELARVLLGALVLGHARTKVADRGPNRSPVLTSGTVR
jgi:hypothetical protein